MPYAQEPLIPQRADPFIYQHTDGYYYFTASVPAFDLIELRRAKTIRGLRGAAPKVVWRRHETGPMSKNIWAPEIHFWDGKWYIYFAAAEADGRGLCHRMYVLENRPQPLEGVFAEKGRINTGWESFSLDGTVFSHEGKRYYVWAQRDASIPGNSNLYIAEMENPWTLKLPAVLLSKPEFDWECQGYLVNEGPAVLKHGGMLFDLFGAPRTSGIAWACCPSARTRTRWTSRWHKSRRL